MRARVIGLGQAAAGDDGVGLAVLAYLRERGVPDGVEALLVSEPSALIPLLETPVPVVLVDAVLGTPPGEVIELGPDELDNRALLSVSSHGMGIPQAVGMARVLAGDAVSPSIRIVGVTIVQPDRFQHGLSPEVAAAIPRAAERALALVKG